ncbi:glycosyltransferase family 2 protein [Accumulibacter sp.]|uniref:glycosyltransferase family 2 protein n=1 Tax=Accumulibacter sp. TaxID=2053492 RepID=UPI0026144AED|nr:glycosyltransferase family 2 protein [Accumulibacter sp.]
MNEPADILISVVIPTYNYAYRLPRALDSVLAQQAADVELIVVDDGSTDQTSDVLAAYRGRYPGLGVLCQANAGAGAARNTGIRAARGSYVLLLDADDQLARDALTSLRAVLAAHPGVGMIIGAHVSVYPDGRERLRVPAELPTASPRELAQRYLLDKRIAISHGCTLFRRDLLLQRPYPESLRSGEDIAVFAYLLVSAPVAVTQHAIARIHKHPGSLRHDRQDEEERARLMTSEVFASLPAECQPLRQSYEARRYLSAFRAAVLADDPKSARRFYWRAFRLSPRQALRWGYARKALRLFFWF